MKDTILRWDVVESPLGPLYVAASKRGVCCVGLGISRQAFLDMLDPTARAERDPAAVAEATRQLQEYLAGQRQTVDVPVDLSRLTPFQRKVLQATRKIPRGTVWTYGQVARKVGNPRAARAVGQALARNPVPIIIPCHRVIASDGGLGGYGGGSGLDTKRWLLRLEQAPLSNLKTR